MRLRIIWLEYTNTLCRMDMIGYIINIYWLKFYVGLLYMD